MPSLMILALKNHAVEGENGLLQVCTHTHGRQEVSISEHTYSDTTLFQLSPQECSPEGSSLDTSQAFQDDMRQTSGFH